MWPPQGKNILNHLLLSTVCDGYFHVPSQSLVNERQLFLPSDALKYTLD